MKDYDFNELSNDEKLLYLMAEFDVLVNSNFRTKEEEDRMEYLENQIMNMINKNSEYKAMYEGTFQNNKNLNRK